MLSLVGTGAFDLVVSVPLILEYEDALMRQLRETGLRTGDVHDVIDYVCSVARRQTIFFLWRPLLKDPKDDMVAEVAVAAGCDAIVTYNVRDFAGVEAFGIKLLTPLDLLKKIGDQR